MRAAWNWLDQAVEEEEINEGFKRAFGTHAPWWRRVFFEGWNVRRVFDRTRCGYSLMDIESVKVTLQAATLLAVVVGLGFTFYQVRLLRLSYVDLHDWNRRKAAQDAVERIEVISKDTPLLNQKFRILTESNRIPLQDILCECEGDQEVRMALNRRLNYFQSLAGGIQQGVFDEEIIRHSYENVFRRTYNQFREYIDYRRDNAGRETWRDFVNITGRWETDNDPSPRASTGFDSTLPRASKSKGG